MEGRGDAMACLETRVTHSTPAATSASNPINARKAVAIFSHFIAHHSNWQVRIALLRSETGMPFTADLELKAAGYTTRHGNELNRHAPRDGVAVSVSRDGTNYYIENTEHLDDAP